eukprot:TRINITY_DN4266_c0_g1_i1.p1 TRINITY_DN4266_c0_g1~~TRINITY_DN4266_c0_g1_i1.p1  ORF type:complete len:282 (-),score=57.42 TRINITY_DN4266_c0_g1_i1:24-869(-)
MFWCCCGDSSNNASQVAIPKPDFTSEKSALPTIQAELDAAEEAEAAGAAFAGNVPAAAASAFAEEAVSVALPPPAANSRSEQLGPASRPEQLGPASRPSAGSQDAPRCFTVALDLARGEEFGIELDLTDEHKPPVVREVKDGAINRWNKTCSPDAVVQPHDRIMTLNGKRLEGGDFLKSLSTPSGKCALEIQRPRQLKAFFKKPGQLGVNMLYKKSSHGIVINEVLESGLVHRWNIDNPKNAVQKGDRIVGINGKMMDAQMVIKAIKEQDDYELILMHYMK